MEQSSSNNTTESIDDRIYSLLEKSFPDSNKRQPIFATIVSLYQENKKEPTIPIYKFLASIYQQNPENHCKEFTRKVLTQYPDPLSTKINMELLTANILRVSQDSLGPHVKNFFHFSFLMTKFLFPLEHLLNEVLLCFQSIHICLKFAIPTLRIINKYCSWMLGVGFILDGIILYIEAMRESNTDPIQRLESFFYIVGGLTCLAILILQPHVYLAVLTTVWGSSTAISISKSIYLLYKKFQAKKLLMGALTDETHTRASLLDKVQELLNNSYIDPYQSAYLKSRIVQLQTNEYGLLDSFDADTLNRQLDPIQNSNPFTNNVFLSNLYLGFSFVCITLSFYGPEFIDLYAVTGFVMSTVLMVGKRLYDYLANPAIENAQQNPFISVEHTAAMGSDSTCTPNLKDIEDHLITISESPNSTTEPELQADVLCGLPYANFNEHLTKISAKKSAFSENSSSSIDMNIHLKQPSTSASLSHRLDFPATDLHPSSNHQHSSSLGNKTVLQYLTELAFAVTTITMSSKDGSHF